MYSGLSTCILLVVEYHFIQTGQCILPSGAYEEDEQELDEFGVDLLAEDSDKGSNNCSYDPTIIPP